GEHPVMVFDRDGNFLRSWGEGQYPRAHGVHMGPDDSIYLTDDGGHFVRKCSLDGKVLLEIGIPGKPAPYMSGEPFHRCTHTALSPSGDIYVSDGSSNRPSLASSSLARTPALNCVERLNRPPSHRGTIPDLFRAGFTYTVMSRTLRISSTRPAKMNLDPAVSLPMNPSSICPSVRPDVY